MVATPTPFPPSPIPPAIPPCHQSSAASCVSRKSHTISFSRTYINPSYFGPDRFQSLRQGLAVLGRVLVLEELDNILIVFLSRETSKGILHEIPEHKVPLESFVELQQQEGDQCSDVGYSDRVTDGVVIVFEELDYNPTVLVVPGEPSEEIYDVLITRFRHDIPQSLIDQLQVWTTAHCESAMHKVSPHR